jgi:hypothetical protein
MCDLQGFIETRIGKDVRSVTLAAMGNQMPEIERINRMIGQAEQRRMTILREIDRYRTRLAKELERATEAMVEQEAAPAAAPSAEAVPAAAASEEIRIVPNAAAAIEVPPAPSVSRTIELPPPPPKPKPVTADDFLIVPMSEAWRYKK